MVIDNGQTGDLMLSFQPETAGDVTVKVTTDYRGENVVWSETLSIEQTLSQNLTGNVVIEGIRNHTIEGTTINATITIKNEGDQAFDDDITISFVEIDDDGYYGKEITEVRSLQLAVGEETKLNRTFPDLVEGQQYLLKIQYYSYFPEYNQVWNMWAASDYCWVGTTLVAYDLDIDMVVKNADSSNKVEGTTMMVDLSVTNNSENDYNDVIILSAYYDGGDGYLYYENGTRMNVMVPAHNTVTLNDVELSNLTVGRKYYIYTEYMSENDYKGGFNWTVYTLVEPPTAIRDVETGANEVIGIYTLDGQRIDTYRKGVNIVKMANGRTRKVVVK